MKTNNEIIRFEEILPATDFLNEEMDKFRGGIAVAKDSFHCSVGSINCNPTGDGFAANLSAI